MHEFIRVCQPVIGEEEIRAVTNALRRGDISGAGGVELDCFEKEFADYCGCEYGIATTSGTTALHLAVAAAESPRGSEVLLSASTNIATALAVVHNGLIPVPVDSENLTWNLDLDLAETLITEKTGAIIPVHLYGHPVDMDRVMRLAKQYSLVVIEDAAEAHGAMCRGRRVGGLGDMGCFSFYANKIITTGEGGMVVTHDARLAARLRLLRNLGFTEPRFWHEVAGYNFRMANYQAAMGVVQVHKLDRILAEKRRVAETYRLCLEGIPGLCLPVELDWAVNVYWMYAIVVEPSFGVTRDQLAEELLKEGIETRTFFCPMDQQPVLQSLEGFRDISCPVAGMLWKCGLYLPSTWSLRDETIKYIADKIVAIRERSLVRGGSYG